MSDKQVGGNHYKKSKLDPIWLIDRLELTFIQGNIIKYCYRAKYKNGIEDLKKAISYCEIASDYIEREIHDMYHHALDFDYILTIHEFCKENNLNGEFYKLVVTLYEGMYDIVKEIINKAINEEITFHYSV